MNSLAMNWWHCRDTRWASGRRGGVSCTASSLSQDLVDPSGGRGQMWTEYALTVYRLPVS